MAPGLPFVLVKAACLVCLRCSDRAADVRQQRANRWSEDDQTGDGENSHERDDQAVLNQALR